MSLEHPFTDMAALSHKSRIVVVGSGVFGISTALWLAKTGYRDVTVYDMQDTAAAAYDPGAGIDSASADLNKIIRFSYGSQIDYQRLATEAGKIWEQWNEQLAATKEGDLPPGLKEWRDEKKLWWNVGYVRMAMADVFSPFELQTLENMKKEGIRDLQFKTDDPADLKRARERGWAHRLDPAYRQERFGMHKAVLDSSGGHVVAFKSCAWASYLAEKAGVKFAFGPVKGKVTNIHTSMDGRSKPIVEIADGTRKEVDLVIVSGRQTHPGISGAGGTDAFDTGGGWTPSLLPETSDLLETTAGSVFTIQIPEHRRDLWDRFGPRNFPVVSWGVADETGIYSFPRDEYGVIKIGYRGTK